MFIVMDIQHHVLILEII